MADKTSKAWEKYLVAHPEAEETIALNGVCEVTAESIKQFREPRLMTKYDSIDGVPKPHRRRLLRDRRPYELRPVDAAQPSDPVYVGDHGRRERHAED